MIPGILHFFKTGIWEIRLRDLPPLRAFCVRVLRIVLLAVRRFIADDCQKTAAVLTYYSLLNVVPVLAVAFAIAKGFGLRKLIESQIVQIAAKANWPASATDQLLAFSHNLLNQAKGGVIAGVGIILLLWTVISILGKIEESLNGIWEIREPRTVVRKFTDYMAMMILGPILLVVSSSVTVLLASQVKVVLDRVAVLGVLGDALLFLLGLLPYVSIWVLMTMVYLIMPNGRMPLKSAIAGGISAGTISQIVQWIYIKFQIGVSTYGAIYGSFAALPLFLAWLQVSWMIVLFGAEIAYACEHYETYGYHPDLSRISVSARRILMLRVFHLLVKKFSAAEPPPDARQIASTLEIPSRLVRNLLESLGEAGLVRTVKGTGKGLAFQPGRTVEDITLKLALDEYERLGTAEIPPSQSEDAEKISKYLKDMAETAEKSPANILLKKI
jgi:membrane protein